MVGTIICEVCTIICNIDTINVRFYLLEVQYSHGYRRITQLPGMCGTQELDTFRRIIKYSKNSEHPLLKK